MTSHKAQGITLDRVEADCRYMTNPGQIGVASGRCIIMKGLRIINYSKLLVKRLRKDIYDFLAQSSETMMLQNGSTPRKCLYGTIHLY